MTSTWTFFCYLDRQAPSHRQFLCKLSRIKHAPIRKKEDSTAIIFRDEMKTKIRKLPKTTHLLALSEWVDCRVERAFHMTYLQASQALSVSSTTASDVREKTTMAYKFTV
jgi:hypothetical protein